MSEHHPGHWLKLADTIARDTDKEPLTFLIGAGASMSSGAPSLAKLERQWMDSDPAAYPNRKQLFEKISTRTDPQKINPIRDLFENVRPYIGYHCLAALAVDRPIFVLNLNWDDALEQACEAVSVPFRHMTVDRKGDLIFPVEDSGKTTRVSGEEHGAALPPLLSEAPSSGVYCLQVHGKLDDPMSGIRIGTYDTLQFTPIVKRVIINKFFCHPTIIVGASLQGEFDIVDLLRQLTQDHVDVPRVLTPIYVFSRQEERTTNPTDKLTQHVLYTRSSDSNFRGDPAVDFDHLLLELTTQLKGEDFQAPFRPSSIPSLEQVALPSPRVLEPPFHASEHKLVVIEGDATVGRTISAALLAHMARICDRDTPEVEVHSGPARCGAALEDLNTASGEDTRVLILENPFGSTGAFRENRKFVKALSRYAKAKSGSSRVIVTTRASNWRMALAESKVKCPEKLISVAVDDWYHSDQLSGYLESKIDLRDRPLLRREIDKGELATPAAINVAVFGGQDPRTEMIKEKVEFLRAISPEAAWCAVLARLQELWPNGVAELPLHSAADRESQAFAEAALMLRSVELDGEKYIVPAHSTDREALDCFFAEHFGDFEFRLEELSRKHGSSRGACELWLAIQDLREGKLRRLQKLPEEVRLNWGARLLEEAARDPDRVRATKRFNKVRSVLLKDKQHFWSMREVVFETIRLWPTLKEDPAAYGFLSEVLSDKKVGKLEGSDRMGRYLILEAMLYVQAATYPGTWDMDAYTRVWDMLSVERHSLLDHPEANARELALMFDAFTWCPPRLGPEELRRWLRDFADGARRCSQLRTAMLCSSLHHPEGFDLLAEQVPELSLRIEDHTLSPEDAEMAAFMISWHFVHQSRARALIYRRSLEPAHSYLLHRIPGELRPALGPALVERCRRVVAELSRFPEHAGWAVHLAMSVAVQRGGFDPSFAAQYIADLPDADQGAIAAAMTYEIPPVLLSSFLAYFDKPANLSALLDAMSKPHEIEGVTVGPPPFCASRLAWQLYGALEIEWERLEEAGFPIDDERSFLEMLFSTTTDLEQEADDDGTRLALRAAAREAASGDLRRLEAMPFRDLSEAGSKMSASELLADLLANAADEIQRENP